eukprot:3042956-Prymnesium_polylepis.1
MQVDRRLQAPPPCRGCASRRSAPAAPAAAAPTRAHLAPRAPSVGWAADEGGCAGGCWWCRWVSGGRLW